MDKIKICFVIPSTDPGGIETYLLRFLKHTGELFESTVIVRSFRKGSLLPAYQDLGVKLHFMPLGYFDPIKAKKYFALVKSIKPDVVCDFNANFAGLSLYLSHLAGVKNRIAFYRQGKNHYKPSFFRDTYNEWSRRMVYKHATQILSNSKASLDFFFPYWQKDKRFKVIYNGVDAALFNTPIDKAAIRNELSIPVDAFVIGHSGRLDPAKNHETILKAAKQLIEKDKNIYLVICGLNTEKLADKVKELKIESNVRLLGFRKDVPSVLKIFDVFYFPSITEGQPNALIEAIISGIPFVASAIVPIKEIIPEHLHSYLVNATDADAAAKKLQDIENNYNNLPTSETQQWAIDFFSPSVRFGEFKSCLTFKE